MAVVNKHKSSTVGIGTTLLHLGSDGGWMVCSGALQPMAITEFDPGTLYLRDQFLSSKLYNIKHFLSLQVIIISFLYNCRFISLK